MQTALAARTRCERLGARAARVAEQAHLRCACVAHCHRPGGVNLRDGLAAGPRGACSARAQCMRGPRAQVPPTRARIVAGCSARAATKARRAQPMPQWSRASRLLVYTAAPCAAPRPLRNRPVRARSPRFAADSRQQIVVCRGGSCGRAGRRQRGAQGVGELPGVASQAARRGEVRTRNAPRSCAQYATELSCAGCGAHGTAPGTGSQRCLCGGRAGAAPRACVRACLRGVVRHMVRALSPPELAA